MGLRPQYLRLVLDKDKPWSINKHHPKNGCGLVGVGVAPWTMSLQAVLLQEQ